jgi:5-methyltetrahydropteroyltriglutamate--homocysteine methyltransferase
LLFYKAGCRYLQLDDTSWGEFCDPDKQEAYRKRGYDLQHIMKTYVHVINSILEVKPADMTVTMHICRGNFRSTWFSSGGYAPVAPILFSHCHVDGFFLEYDTDRAGDFQPLSYINGQKVVLGLITSKFPELEKEEDIVSRVKEATQYVPLSQLCLSSQCGFASTEEGNLLTEEQQWAKIAWIKKIADDIWG